MRRVRERGQGRMAAELVVVAGAWTMLMGIVVLRALVRDA